MAIVDSIICSMIVYVIIFIGNHGLLEKDQTSHNGRW